MKKRFIITILLITLIVSLLIIPSCGRGKKAEEKEVIKIGAILPLTGPGAMYGIWAKQGLMIAKKILQENGHKIELILLDSKSNPKDGLNAFNKLKSQKVSIIIGDIMSSVTMAIAPNAEQSRIILFSPGSSNPIIPDIGKFVFRNWPSDNYEAYIMAKYFKENNFDNIGVCYINNDYGLGLKDEFMKFISKEKVNFISSYDGEQKNMKQILLKAANNKVKNFYIIGHVDGIANLIKQATELSLKFNFYSAVGAEGDKLIEIAGHSANGLIYTYLYMADSNKSKLIHKFYSYYSKEYEQTPEIFAATAFDALQIIYKAIIVSNYIENKDITKLRQTLLTIEFDGVTGYTQFLPNGDVNKNISLKYVKNGKFEILKKEIK